MLAVVYAHSRAGDAGVACQKHHAAGHVGGVDGLAQQVGACGAVEVVLGLWAAQKHQTRGQGWPRLQELEQPNSLLQCQKFLSAEFGESGLRFGDEFCQSFVGSTRINRFSGHCHTFFKRTCDVGDH